MQQLDNSKLGLNISATGGLLAIRNHLASEIYTFTADTFELVTDQGTYSNIAVNLESASRIDDALHYQFKFDQLKIKLVYRLGADRGFVRRWLEIENHGPVRLLKLTFGQTVFGQNAEEAIHYLTFWMAPTVEFLRYRHGGLFTGIENPFYKSELSVRSVALSFEPSLILTSDEGYVSEPQFIGVYKKSGVMIEDSARPFRYPNGTAHIPIDRNESRSMRLFALDYLQPAQQNFLNINYQFFHPLPQMPSTPSDKWYFIKTIDTFARIGGDMIIFKPLHRHCKPDVATPYWNLIPEDKGAIARQITDYAAQKGIAYGFYIGIAGGHGEEGNSGGLPLRADKIGWKKLDASGRRSSDNCNGSDEFYEWWLRVHDTTIKKYRLSNWSWDPSIGSAMNCYDETHGHIAGKGGYKGWRRCISLIAQLKLRNPGLFIQGFYGTKQFGLWGLKHTDQHEVYNEQTAIVCTHHTQISDDRQNADGLRFQNYWSMRFRFLPTVMGHSLVHRICEGEFDRELIKAWDFYGWRYSLMSALAVSGSVMPVILPVDSALVPGFEDFYHKWSRWAKANFEYVAYTEPFGEQVQPGCIDGYARIKGDHGFVFLFNGNPRSTEITFEVGDEINLQIAGNYEFIELYPIENRRVVDKHGQEIFALGTTISLIVPANCCRLLELRQFVQPYLPQHNHEPEALNVSDIEGYPRELDNWTMSDGCPFDFPHHDLQHSVSLTTAFHLNPAIAELLKKAEPKNIAEMGVTIGNWQTSNEISYSYHNFIGSRPERLWLVIPFTLQKASNFTFAAEFSVSVFVNECVVGDQVKRDANSNSFYLDMTDLVKYGLAPQARNTVRLDLRNLQPNEFMGPYLLYPWDTAVENLFTDPEEVPMESGRVVYTRPLILPGPPRYRKNGIPPRITDAWVIGNVTLTQSTQLRVLLNTSECNLKSVRYSHSGFPWMGVVALEYCQLLACWVAEVEPGARSAIQESEMIYVWAVGCDGLLSDYYPVKIGWDFLK